MGSKLQTINVSENASAAFQAQDSIVVIKVTTTEASDITVQTSIDGNDFTTNANFTENVNGTKEFNITDLKNGQYVKVVATSGTMTALKVLV